MAGQARSVECPTTATAAVWAMRHMVPHLIIVIRSQINRGDSLPTLQRLPRLAGTVECYWVRTGCE